MTKYISQNNIQSINDDGMIINMESGNFGSAHRGLDLPLTEFDEVIDLSSNNKGHQLLEKQISGMYIGEIVRVILRKYMENGFIFTNFSNCLNSPYHFETNTVSEIVSDNSKDLDLVAERLREHGITGSTFGEREFVKTVSFLVGKRAACLASIQITAILRHIGQEKENVVVAIDGSVYEKFTDFKKNVENYLQLLLGMGHRVNVQLVKDGSGIGAALAAFLADK